MKLTETGKEKLLKEFRERFTTKPLVNRDRRTFVMDDPWLVKHVESFLLEKVAEAKQGRHTTVEVADVILTAMRSYRLRFPDATYDDAIGVVMGFMVPLIEIKAQVAGGNITGWVVEGKDEG